MFKWLALACLFAGACVSTPDKPTTDDYIPTKSDKMGAVLVGVETSKIAGNCPGSRKDALDMQSVVECYTDNIKVFIAEQAIKADIVAALQEAVAKYEYVFFYYSGHGGSEKLSTTGAEEADGKDEFLCFYDKYMLDNEVWSIISKAKGKVFLIFDCCHSETMFRTPQVTFKNSLRRLSASRTASDFAMLCWSGCPDNTVSYGSASGGMFTRAISNYLTFTSTYREIWGKVSTDKWLLQSQSPKQTVIGDWDLDAKVFQ